MFAGDAKRRPPIFLPIFCLLALSFFGRLGMMG
jgi:hypothetical protein